MGFNQPNTTNQKNSPQGGQQVQPGGIVGGAKLGNNSKVNPMMTQANDMHQVKDDMSDITRRLKLLEERINQMRSKSVMLEDNIMSEKKHVDKISKDLNAEIRANKLLINKAKDDIILIIKELQTLAKKDKLDTLSKYIEFWTPINYVSQNEVEKIVKDKVEEALKDMAMKEQQENFIEELINKKLRDMR